MQILNVWEEVLVLGVDHVFLGRRALYPMSIRALRITVLVDNSTNHLLASVPDASNLGWLLCDFDLEVSIVVYVKFIFEVYLELLIAFSRFLFLKLSRFYVQVLD